MRVYVCVRALINYLPPSFSPPPQPPVPAPPNLDRMPNRCDLALVTTSVTTVGLGLGTCLTSALGGRGNMGILIWGDA